MSIARDMRAYMLQEKILNRGKSGGKTPGWKDVQEIDVAVYKNSELIVSASERYKNSTHTGLTYHKDIKSGKHRLAGDDGIYQIVSADTEHRLTNLMLKAVDTNV